MESDFQVIAIDRVVPWEVPLAILAALVFPIVLANILVRHARRQDLGMWSASALAQTILTPLLMNTSLACLGYIRVVRMRSFVGGGSNAFAAGLGEALYLVFVGSVSTAVISLVSSSYLLRHRFPAAVTTRRGVVLTTVSIVIAFVSVTLVISGAFPLFANWSVPFPLLLAFSVATGMLLLTSFIALAHAAIRPSSISVGWKVQVFAVVSVLLLSTTAAICSWLVLLHFRNIAMGLAA